MPRRLSIEERIKRLEENRVFAVQQAQKRVDAMYRARIDLLREKGLPSKEKRLVPRSLVEMMNKAKDRYVFVRTRFYEYMGLTPSEASAKALEEYEKYRVGWLARMRG